MGEKAPALRVQRTQLLNLQPAGGKQNNNSSFNVFGGDEVDSILNGNGNPRMHIESLEENYLKS